ncbi:MAG TPA: zinc-binding alcohol dehydrogenase [Cyanobacteria bacterium UBA8803]|nr:zinc-binding alcohol dehydrogenase [Cyanobacteria bacterium UBA9273]HBL61106.1 zinc-binding alcohol dehydrogenase [Cyanobacteria bacterium UBA8803]
MKAVIINQYGSTEVLEYSNIETPQITSDQLLIKVRATSVNPVDWKIRKGMLKPLTGNKFPMVLGMDISGEVVEVGNKVTGFKVGDAIYAYIGKVPGGAYAEYAAVAASAVALKPSNMTYEQAAAIPVAALTALQSLRDLGNIEKGQKVLINGGSGGVGTYAVQIAKALATEVTAVCSTRNVELVIGLGVDRVIDYTQQDFTKDTVKYDIILDAVANQVFSRCRAILQPQGVYVTTLPSPRNLLEGMLTSIIPGQKVKLVIAKARGNDLAYLNSLIEAGKMRSVIDRTYPLSEARAAHAYSEEGHAVGKIVMTV